MALLQAYYNTGTCTVAAGGTAVTGQGTAWLSSVRAGDLFGTHKGSGVRIASVNSNTSLTLAYDWQGGAQTAEVYEIALIPAGAEILGTARALLESLTNGNLAAFAGLDGSGGNKGVMMSGAGAAATYALTDAGRALLGLTGGNGKIPVWSGLSTAAARDILGTVSQSSGVPTGALIEYGSNANGDYTRWADGTQICRRLVSVGGSGWTAAAWGTYVSGGAVSWAAAFSAAPLVTVNAHDGAISSRSAYVVTTPATTTGVSAIWLASPNPSATSGANVNVHLNAIGRWF